jgi:hypothetical protein
MAETGVGTVMAESVPRTRALFLATKAGVTMVFGSFVSR